MDMKIELKPSLVGRNYFVTETYGPYIRVTSSQGNHLDDGLIFWFKDPETSVEEKLEHMRETARKGTVLHGMFANHLLGKKAVVEEEWSQKPFDYFKEFCLAQCMRPADIEKTMVSRNLGLGGTVDAVVDFIDDRGQEGEEVTERWILDWKTGAKSEAHIIQLAIYAVMWWELTGEWIPNQAAVYVHRDGKKAKFVKSEAPLVALKAGLHTFERWKWDNAGKLLWVCAPEEVIEEHKKLKGAKRKAFEDSEYREEYSWPWLKFNSLIWLQDFHKQVTKGESDV